MEEYEVVLLRLWSGEMLMGQVDAGIPADERGEAYALKDPRTVAMVPTMRGDVHVAMRPVSAPFAVERLKKRLSVPVAQVMFRLEEGEIEKELVNGYRSDISGIKLATAADAAALGAQPKPGEFSL